MDSNWSDQATWSPPAPPLSQDPPATADVAPAPIAPVPAPAPLPSSFSVGVAVLLVGVGAGAGYVLGGGWGAGAGALFVGATRNAINAKRQWPADPATAAKSASFALVGAGIGAYLAYRAHQSRRGSWRRVSAVE